MLVALLVGAAPGGAAPGFDCSGAGRALFETVCADAELVRLDCWLGGRGPGCGG